MTYGLNIVEAKHKTSQKKMPAAELEEEEEGEEAGNEMEEDDVGDDEVDTAEFVDLEDATSVAEDKRERIGAWPSLCSPYVTKLTNCLNSPYLQTKIPQ